MAETAQVFGTGFPIDFDGHTYQIEPLTLDHLAMFEVWCEDQAFRKVERLRGKITADVYQQRLDAVARQVVSGAFGFGGELARQMSQTDAGLRYLFFLSLSRNEDMDEVLANKILDFDRAQAQVKMNLANAQEQSDPNASTPAKQAS